MLWKIYSIASSLLSTRISLIKQFFSVHNQYHNSRNIQSKLSSSNNINMLNNYQKYFSINVYVPTESSQKVREALANSKAGMIGNYDSCSFTTKGIGRFRPLENANPTIGTINRIEEVEEEKIEVVVLEKDLQNVLEAIVKAHPYEEPAIQVFPMIDYKSLLSSSSTTTTTTTTTNDVINTNNNIEHIPNINSSGISIVIEGLDGVGKTTICKALATRLNALLLTTPPSEMKSYRNYFIEAKTETGEEDLALRKAYYMVGNFMVGNQMETFVKQPQQQYVVLDRYYASTMAYILGKKKRSLLTSTYNNNNNNNDTNNDSTNDNEFEPLPQINDKILEWPKELYKPNYMFVIILHPENDRILRRSLRLDINETIEEAYLRENPIIPERINQLYLLFNCIPIYITINDSIEEIINKIIQNISEIK